MLLPKKPTTVAAKSRAKNNDGIVGKFSIAYLCKKTKLLGHIARAANDDPLREVTFGNNNGKPIGVSQRGVGKPRKQWTFEAMNQVWKSTQKTYRTSRKPGPLQEKVLQSQDFSM